MLGRPPTSRPVLVSTLSAVALAAQDPLPTMAQSSSTGCSSIAGVYECTHVVGGGRTAAASNPTGPCVEATVPSPAALSVTGDPRIGGNLSIHIVGATGLGFTRCGFAPPIPRPTPCGCDIISDSGGGLGFFEFLPTYDIAIPVDAFLTGATIRLQGLDVFPSSGGCTFVGVPSGASSSGPAAVMADPAFESIAGAASSQPLRGSGLRPFRTCMCGVDPDGSRARYSPA